MQLADLIASKSQLCRLGGIKQYVLFLLKPMCKYPGKADHSHLEIFLHTDYVPGGDRHAQSP
ncbi:hypothetical protein, partial [Klebsiella quasipneumoniae]|uniref:hypothetical protein n=1 Tax=Klebsiella quasipneumoniae TaxID=1463165 RepID=UPI001CC26F8B